MVMKSRSKGRVRGETRFKGKGKRYKNKDGKVFGEGDTVTLKPKVLTLYKKTEGEVFAGLPVTRTRIAFVFPDIKGLVRLEARLGGYWTWDVNDLQ